MDNLNDISGVNLNDDAYGYELVSSDDSESDEAIDDSDSDSDGHGDCDVGNENESENDIATNHDEHKGNNNKNRDPLIDVDGEKFKSIVDLTEEDILGLDFGTEQEAYEFYRTYGKCIGFAVRKDDVKRDVRGQIRMQQFVCNKEGERNKKHLMRVDRKRDHRPLTRTSCTAKIRVHYNMKTNRWKVVSFKQSHNHELCPSVYRHLITANRCISDADKAQIDSLHEHGVRTCHIMGYMVAQRGGYGNLCFSRKDVYNYLDSKNRNRIKGGDARAALSYLQGKSNSDPMLYCKYTIDEKNRLRSLFWADGACVSDYLCFGDVIAFDTTYKKNRYQHPLVIFSGCNHHSQIVIFGFALVPDERIDTYKWVLQAFSEAMFNKQPKSVVTDGDGAMREAIKQVFPNASHRLCAWHLQKNACENVKRPPFLEDFQKAVYSNFTPQQFEYFWEKMVLKHGLVGNNWVSKTYENKALWATAYLRDKFFARIRTTSQCESINAFIKAYVRKKSSFVELMHNTDQALREYINNEMIADYKSLFTEPVLTTSLYKVEKEASKIYTLEIFKEVKHEIEKAGALIVIDRRIMGDKLLFKLNQYCKPGKERNVQYDSANSIFSCDCSLFESRGIPCSHIFCAMKNEHVDHIPRSLIIARWTKNAKRNFRISDDVQEVPSDVNSSCCI